MYIHRFFIHMYIFMWLYIHGHKRVGREISDVIYRCSTDDSSDSEVTAASATLSDRSPGSPLAEHTKQLPITTTTETASDQPRDVSVTTAEHIKQPPSDHEVANITAESLEQEIEKEIQELEEQFFSVAYKAAQDLETVDLLKIKVCIMQLSASTKFLHMKFLQENHTAISNAKNVQEIFFLCAMYWDFLNCGLLNEIVRKLGNYETKQLMEKYTEKLREFRVKTKLEDFIDKWARSCPAHFSEFVSKMGDWRYRTLEDLENFRIELARTICVEEYALHYIKIKPGSVSVTWALPSSLTEIADTLNIFPQLQKEYNVLMVAFQGKHIPELSELAPQEVSYCYHKTPVIRACMHGSSM